MTVTAAPKVGENRPFAPPAVVRTTLPNGLELLVVSKNGMPVVDVQLLVRGGGVLDSPAEAGRASLTAELIDEGTERYSALGISDQVEFLGADLDLRAGWDACFCSCHGLSTRLPAMLDLLGEVALRPTFPDEEFQRKHEERLHQLAQERDEPRLVASKSLSRAAFGDHHPFGRPLSGTVRTIESLRRSSLLSYYGRAFAPSNAHLVMVGDVTEELALKLAKEKFGKWSAVADAQADLPAIVAGARSIRLIDRPGAAQSEVRVGHVGPPRGTPDYFALQVMNTILGGSFKSRLNMTLRERKGFTYGASSALALRRDGGLFSAGAAVFTDNTAETVAIMLHEISRIREEPVTMEEQERARRYLALGFMRHFETTNDVASHIAELALYDLPDSWLQDYPARIARVSIEDVRAAAQRHLLPEQLAVVVVGDKARVLESLQKLELGPVEFWEAE